MSKETLKNKIDADITTNGLRQITGAKLNDILNDVVDEMALDGGIVEEGNTQAVSGGEVYNYVDNQLSRDLTADLEIGGIATLDGTDTTATIRARTNDFLNGTKAILTSLNLFLFRIYYYSDDGTFVNSVSTGYVTEYDINYPAGATKYRVALSKNPSTEDIIQSDIDNSVLTYGKQRYDFEYIDKSKVIDDDYNNAKLDYNNSFNELGGISTSIGENTDNNIRIRSKSKIPVLQQNYSIENVTPGYVLSRIFRYKDGVFFNRVDYPTNTFTPDSTYNEVRLVWEKINNTEVITIEELNDFNFNLYSDDDNKLQIIAERSNKIPFIERRLSSLEQTSGSKWNGKKMASIGDSITFGFVPRNAPNYPGQLDSYAKLASQKLGMSFNNYGISGSTLGQVSELDTTTRNPMIYRYNVMPNDADLITFSGGTNDLRNIAQLGTMEDRIGWTWYGALHILCQGLLNKYVYADLENPKTIVAVTPIKLFPNSTLNGLTIKDYRDVMIEVANYYAIPVFDAWALSGMTPEEFRTLQGTETGYTDMYNPLITDGVHPTQEGHEIFANAFVGFLKTI